MALHRLKCLAVKLKTVWSFKMLATVRPAISLTSEKTLVFGISAARISYFDELVLRY